MKSLNQMNIEHQQAEFAFGGRSLTGNPNAKKTPLTKDSVRAMKMAVRKPRKRGGYLEAFNKGVWDASKINLIQGLSGMS